MRRFHFTLLLAISLVWLILGLLQPALSIEPVKWEGTWKLELRTPGGPLPIHTILRKSKSGRLTAVIQNGEEEIAVETLAVDNYLILDFPHYDSKIMLTAKPGETAEGHWQKTRGLEETASLVCTAMRQGSSLATPATPNVPPATLGKPFLGRFEVKFADDAEPAVAVFREAGNKSIGGTFMTTTGDYRYLTGSVDGDGVLTLACFDGAHAFLFKARNDNGKLTGDFWSGDWYHTAWQATHNPDARLADGFAQATVNESVKLEDLAYIDLKGKPRSLADPSLRGKKLTVLEVFGSWCPNCHDAASLLGELSNKHQDRGMKVVGLGFEITGNVDRDTRQLARYRDRFEIDYPILLAGLSDKTKASQSFPLIDRIRSFPTTIFIDQAGKVRAVYSGFSGPATGDAHQQLRASFERIIEKLLNE